MQFPAIAAEPVNNKRMVPEAVEFSKKLTHFCSKLQNSSVEKTLEGYVSIVKNFRIRGGGKTKSIPWNHLLRENKKLSHCDDHDVKFTLSTSIVIK